jgi:hypothetical protein
MSAPADGSAPPAALVSEAAAQFPSSVSPDGKTLIGDWIPGARPTNPGANGLWSLLLGEGSAARGTPQTFLDTAKSNLDDPQFSPVKEVMQWVAFTSSESGRNEVYVVPYPGPGPKIPISTGGGARPMWSANGRELFFRGPGVAVMAVDVVQSGAALRASPPRMLFANRYGAEYDVSPDGKHFLMIKAAEAVDERPAIHVIVNWFEELRRKAGGEFSPP